MAKQTVAEKIRSKKITKPGFMYTLLGWVWKTFMYKKYNVNVIMNVDMKKVKEPHIFISNHASRLDYIFTGVPLYPTKYNFVAGYNEFHRSHLAGVFSLLKVIPKKNFTPDIYTIKSISNIIKSGGNITIFPEGMSSISGANQPVAVGTGKFIKNQKVPVYYSVIKGGYLTSPKYNLKDRLGYVEVVFDQMFTKEELETLTPQEIEDIMNKKLYHDDYAWNKVHKHRYKIGKEGALHLEDLLFWCPKCGKQHTMKTEGNKIFCTECGNGATLLDTYELVPFNGECVIPETQTKWFNLEREIIKEEIKDPNFELKEKVKLGMLPKYELLKDQKTSEIVGEGILTLNHQGLAYNGTKDNEEFSFFIPILNVPTYGMCTDVSRFYSFYNGEFVEFYPENNVVEKFFLATEEIHRLHDGKWQDFKFNK